MNDSPPSENWMPFVCGYYWATPVRYTVVRSSRTTNPAGSPHIEVISMPRFKKRDGR